MSWDKVAGEGGKSERSNSFVTLEPGKVKRLHCLLLNNEEPTSYWTHYLESAKRSVNCSGKATCPACLAGINGVIKHSMNVYDYETKQVLILEKGNKVYKQIRMIHDLHGSLDKVDIAIKSTGKGKATDYVVVQMEVGQFKDGPRHDLSELAKPATPEAIKELLAGESFEPKDLETLDEPVVPTGPTMQQGKYKGKTLDEIVKIDRGYVEWVSENFNDAEFIEAANKALGPKEEAPLQGKVINTVHKAKVVSAAALIEQYKNAGGSIQAVASLMRDVGNKKVLLDTFTDEELDKFTEKMNDTIEALEHE